MILHSDITDKIIGCFYRVYNILGFGFLEKVYENALIIELQTTDLFCLQQAGIKVYYQEKEVGSYFADILVEKNYC